MAKIVSITYFSDSVDGSRLVELRNHVCQLYDLMREDEKSFKTLSNYLDTPALYILLNRRTNHAYIGQTDSFTQRITQHLARKKFWDEVLAFIASDGSINSTEVQFLESLAYSEANEAGSYDLSENSQIPRPRNITQAAKINSLAFFGDVCDLTKIVGCDIFIRNYHVKVQQKPATINIKENSIAPAIEKDALKGRGVKIMLNGKGPYNKGRIVLEIIRQFLQEHPEMTLSQIKEVFPQRFLGSWSNWNLIETDIERAKSFVDKKGRKSLRHFVDDDCILTSGDGVRFVVSSQWDFNNLPCVLTLAQNWGWDMEIVKN